MSEQDDQLFTGPPTGDLQEDPPAVTVQAGLATATISVTGPEEDEG